MEKILHIDCPHCGTRFIDGIKATNLEMTCKRCRGKIILSFDVNYMKIEIMRLRKSKLYISCPCCGTRLVNGECATDIVLICPRCRQKMIASFDDKTIFLKICHLVHTVAL